MPNWPFTIRPRASRLIVPCGVLIVAVIAARIATVVADLHSRALADRERELQNISIVLADQADRMFAALDLMATTLTERMGALAMSSTDQFGRAMSRPDIHLLLEQKVGDIPNVEAIALFDAKGNLVNFSRFWPIPVLNISHREHFQAFTSDPSLTSFVSQPYQNHTVGSWSITLLRRAASSWA